MNTDLPRAWPSDPAAPRAPDRGSTIATIAVLLLAVAAQVGLNRALQPAREQGHALYQRYKQCSFAEPHPTPGCAIVTMIVLSSQPGHAVSRNLTGLRTDPTLRAEHRGSHPVVFTLSAVDDIFARRLRPGNLIRVKKFGGVEYAVRLPLSHGRYLEATITGIGKGCVVPPFDS